ncbi:hypothetical protein HN51_035830 [Arachis hypogaea]
MSWPVLTTISKYQDFVRIEGRSNKIHLTFLSEGLKIAELTRLYSGDSYIVQYTFLGNGRDEALFYAWLGCKSVTEDLNFNT